MNEWVSTKRYRQLAVTGSMLTTILSSAAIGFDAAKRKTVSQITAIWQMIMNHNGVGRKACPNQPLAAAKRLVTSFQLMTLKKAAT